MNIFYKNFANQGIVSQAFNPKITTLLLTNLCTVKVSLQYYV